MPLTRQEQAELDALEARFQQELQLRAEEAGPMPEASTAIPAPSAAAADAMPEAAPAPTLTAPTAAPPAPEPAAPPVAAAPSPADVPVTEADFAPQVVDRGPRTITSEDMTDEELMAVAERMNVDPRTWGGAVTQQPQQAAPGQIAYRGQVLPAARTVEGDIVFAWPEPLVMGANTVRDLVEGRRTPREISGAELANLGFMVAGGSVAAGRARPRLDQMSVTDALSLGAEAAYGTTKQRLARIFPVLPETSALRTATSAAYKVVDDSGAHIKPNVYDEFVGRTVAEVNTRGYDPLLQKNSTVILRRLQEALQGPVTVTRLDNLRKLAGGIARGNDPDEARVAGNIIGQIDKFFDSLKMHHLTIPSGRKVPASVIIGSLKQGRLYSKQARKAELLDKMVSDAYLDAPQFSGSGLENALTRQFRSLAKGKKMKMFNKREKRLIKKIVYGGNTIVSVGNLLRMAGKFAPTGIVSTALSGGTGAYVGGELGAIALPVAGFAARQGATAVTKRHIRQLQKRVRNVQPDAEMSP